MEDFCSRVYKTAQSAEYTMLSAQSKCLCVSVEFGWLVGCCAATLCQDISLDKGVSTTYFVTRFSLGTIVILCIDEELIYIIYNGNISTCRYIYGDVCMGAF